MEMTSVDGYSVILAAVLYMVIHTVWFSKSLFGPIWIRYVGSSEADSKVDAAQMAWGTLNAVVIAYFLAFFEGCLGVTTVSDGMFVAFCFWLGFVATTQINAVIWRKSPWPAFFINTGVKLVSYLVMGGILGA